MTQPALFEDGFEELFARALHGGHLSRLLDLAARRALDIGDAESLQLLRDVAPEVDDDYDPMPFIEANEWVVAKTDPAPIKHEYVLIRRATDWREQLRFVRWLRVTGELELFEGRRYPGRVVDGHRYWAMADLDHTIANRRRLPASGSVQLESPGGQR
jgi:hypothetical protein